MFVVWRICCVSDFTLIFFRIDWHCKVWSLYIEWYTELWSFSSRVQLDTYEVFDDFRRFPTIFRRFPNILRMLSEVHTNVSEHFPKITEDCRGRSGDISWRCAWFGPVTVVRNGQGLFVTLGVMYVILSSQYIHCIPKVWSL